MSKKHVDHRIFDCSHDLQTWFMFEAVYWVKLIWVNTSRILFWDEYEDSIHAQAQQDNESADSKQSKLSFNFNASWASDKG